MGEMEPFTIEQADVDVLTAVIYSRLTVSEGMAQLVSSCAFRLPHPSGSTAQA